ncbi:hypothetical protein O3P69_005789 [Scylla paramamosain]|uniref:Uncharacterized protein n=1 Tax=Scylla paramamosain TaxID=85552 RepID=A0AAW0U9G9_SCYPA
MRWWRRRCTGQVSGVVVLGCGGGQAWLKCAELRYRREECRWSELNGASSSHHLRQELRLARCVVGLETLCKRNNFAAFGLVDSALPSGALRLLAEAVTHLPDTPNIRLRDWLPGDWGGRADRQKRCCAVSVLVVVVVAAVLLGYLRYSSNCDSSSTV